ncbi:hypothetical protein CVT24_009669 [Panaeolus cyanescens]|uniref:Uncharacterized protein n=1 Tax=Panaeolus cyanescens TaxID=181874 RepID=A0A409Y9I8_9AGAR|nr:hypothetical protein CVT24_009669 [Panaeolus cyanescens]
MAKLISNTCHGNGLTCLAFSADGSRAFTGGKDCLVRIWKMSEGAEQEPEAATEAEGDVTCLATTSDCWLSGSEDTEVRRYAKDSNQLEGVVTTTSGVSVRCISIDPEGKRVAVTSDSELTVKVVDLEDTMEVKRLDGYKSGVRSASWHPSGSLLTTCTADGKIVIWDMTTEQPKIETTIEGLIPAVNDSSADEFQNDSSAIWHTSGDYFFVPTKGHEIATVSRSTWTKTGTLSNKDVAGTITALALSSNGVYLASACQSKVHVWSTKTRQLVVSQSSTPGIPIVRLAFSPRENLIAWTDTSGTFTRWPKPIPSDMPDPVKAQSTNNGASLSLETQAGLDLFEDDLLEKADLNDVVLDGDDDMADMNDDWIVDDMNGAHSAELSKKEADGNVKEMVSITKAQKPFQPGSTPMLHKKQYLAHNMIGSIEVTDQDTHHIVNVEFFDKSLRKGYHFSDTFKYNLGYLGERGAVFACLPQDGHPAEVLFKPYTSSKTNDWTYSLARKDPMTGDDMKVEVLGVAAGAAPLTKNSNEMELQGYGNVVIATSENDLTFLSGTGRERRIMALPGEFVTMVAATEWVLVVHRAGSTTIDGSQNLWYTMINFEDFSVRQRDILPVPKKHTLKWIGLTDQEVPAIYDSAGHVHVLTKHRIPHHASWARVLDTNLLDRRQGKHESYWPVGISENHFMCLILKGLQEHPGFPRPLIQELPLRIPFRRDAPKDEKIEREQLQTEMMLDALDEELTTPEITERERAIDKELIILIQEACKASNVARALELVKLLHNNAFLDPAATVAGFYHHIGLQEKINIIKAERLEAEERLTALRNKRRRWLKPEAPLRQVAPSSSSGGARFDPLADTRPPPVIERPGMARVNKPIFEPTRYSSRAPASQLPPPSSVAETSVFDEPVDIVDSPPTNADAKRKRMEVDDFPGVDSSMPPPKQSKFQSNPFARKLNEPSKNPFARKLDNKPIHKSDSFFDKVDAAESEPPKKRPFASKPKDSSKEKKDGPKQTTLFGMMPPKSDKSKPKKSSTPTLVESQDTDTQMTDVVMGDLDSQILVEDTQNTEDTQNLDTNNWEETQLVDDESQLSTVS